MRVSQTSDLHPCLSLCTFTAPRCLLIQEVSPTTTVITPTKEFWKGSYSFKESFQQMFSHRQHLNKLGVSHLPQSLILPVHSSHPQTQHEINSNVTRLHLPGAMRCAANSAYSDSKASQNIPRVQNLFKQRAEDGLGGSGNGMQCLLSPGEPFHFSPGEQPLHSWYYTRAAQKPA